MSFLYPTFLFALFAVLIPVIIHLFNFRTYKTIYFSNVQFLKNVKQETKSKSNLKHLLILLMRILAIASLVFAFARPYILSDKQNSTPSQNKIGIYIDNSFSTQAENKYGKILEIEKKKALEIAKAFSEDTRFLFLTNKFDLKHQHFVSKEQFKDFVLETNNCPSPKKISSVISKFESIFRNSDKETGMHSIYIISDFQKTSSDINKINTDSNTNIFFIPILPEKTANIFIDSVWFENPSRPVNQKDELNYGITNTSDEAYTQMPVKLYIDGNLKSTGSFNINAHSHITGKVNFTNNKQGIVNGKLEISDFPITYDNLFYFNYNLNDTNKILIIREKNTPNKFINNVFKSLKNVILKTVSVKNVNSVKLSNYNVVISDGLNKFSNKLNENLLNFSNDGGILIIFPTVNCNIKSYNNFFNEANLNYITGFDTSKIDAEKINYNSNILKNVFKKKEKNTDMPYVLKRVNFSNLTNIDEEVILYSEKNDKLITSAKINKGEVFTFAQGADDSYGNLVFHPLWVSLLYNMAFYNSAGKNIYYTIGNDFVIQVKNNEFNPDKVFRIVNKEKNVDIIPQSSNIESSDTKLFINNELKEAGHYNIFYGNKLKSGISINFNRKESNLSHYSLNNLKDFSSDLSEKNISVLKAEKELLKETVINNNQGIRLHKLFLILTLLFIALEIVFIKFLK